MVDSSANIEIPTFVVMHSHSQVFNYISSGEHIVVAYKMYNILYIAYPFINVAIPTISGCIVSIFERFCRYFA